MAIDDIDNLRREFPAHFQDKDSGVLPGYLRLPTNEPATITHPSDEELNLDEPQDPDADPASIIEEELAEWDPHAELESLDPELQDIFGGHPGGVQDDRPENHTGLDPKTTVIDRLAFYLPFHYFRDWWGIYILPEGILRIRQELQPFFRIHGIGPREQVRLAKQLLYHHEYYHHAVESFGTRLEAVVNKPCYLSGFSPRYRQTVHSSQCLEETCANSYAREKLLKNHKALGVARGDLAAAINHWFSGQPSGYREAKDTNGTWTKKLRPLLFEDYVQATPGLGSVLSSGASARSPISSSGVAAAWSIAGHMDRGIGDIRSRIAYLIPKGSPLYNRLPTDARTCVKGRSFKQKLKSLGIARFHRQGGSHEIWESTSNNCRVPIPRHDGVDIPKGTMRGILRQLGTSMSIDEFLAA